MVMFTIIYMDIPVSVHSKKYLITILSFSVLLLNISIHKRESEMASTENMTICKKNVYGVLNQCLSLVWF